MTIILERLALLPTLTLDRGAHRTFEDGHCLNEVAAWLTGRTHTDKSPCVSPVLRSYTMRLNDRWSDEDRQLLLPYAAWIVGTAGDGQDAARLAIAQAALVTDLMPAWLRLAGLDAEADTLAELDGADLPALRVALRRVRDAAWVKRLASRRDLKERLRGHLASAVADAAAAADAVADAAASASAVADAAADAVAVAAAAAAAAASWSVSYSAARRFWDCWIAEDPQAQPIRDLAATQRQQALAVLDRMIDPSAATPGFAPRRRGQPGWHLQRARNRLRTAHAPRRRVGRAPDRPRSRRQVRHLPEPRARQRHGHHPRPASAHRQGRAVPAVAVAAPRSDPRKTPKRTATGGRCALLQTALTRREPPAD